MAQIKGVLLNAWVDLLKSRYGERAVAEAFDSVSRNDTTLISSFFLASNWYPYSSLDALRRVTRALATPASPVLSEEVGRCMAEYVFKGVYRTLLVKDPVKQIEKFSSINEFFFQDTYKLETSLTGDSRCQIRYRYEQGTKPTRSICESLGGFWSRAIELAGARNVKSAHTRCVIKGDPCCDFELNWRQAGSSAS